MQIHDLTPKEWLKALGIGPKLIVASLVPHLLFAAFLWGLCRLLFATTR